MAQPLRSADPNPQDVRFSHFGVLNTGSRSKGAAATSITINILIALLAIVLGAVVKTNVNNAKKLAVLELPAEPPKPQPPPPPPPKLPPPPKIKLPDPPKIEPPKIKMPEPVKMPDIKPIEVPTPKPMVTAPAPPKINNPVPAPKTVSLANAMAASVPNNDAHPTAVRLGNPDNPLKPMTGPAVSRVNMGVAGMPGMNAANSGNGPRATKVSMGNGDPNGSMAGNSSGHPVAGVKLGCVGCTGPLNSTNYANAPKQVQLQTASAHPAVRQPEVHAAVVASPPKVTYKPTPTYTAEAKSMHLEGAVSIRIKVLSSGAVEVLSVTHGLGHGLDQSAIQAIESTRFQPAKDSAGQPIEWIGVVNVNFQMS